MSTSVATATFGAMWAPQWERFYPIFATALFVSIPFVLIDTFHLLTKSPGAASTRRRAFLFAGPFIVLLALNYGLGFWKQSGEAIATAKDAITNGAPSSPLPTSATPAVRNPPEVLQVPPPTPPPIVDSSPAPIQQQAPVVPPTVRILPPASTGQKPLPPPAPPAPSTDQSLSVPSTSQNQPATPLMPFSKEIALTVIGGSHPNDDRIARALRWRLTIAGFNVVDEMARAQVIVHTSLVRTTDPQPHGGGASQNVEYLSKAVIRVSVNWKSRSGLIFGPINVEKPGNANRYEDAPLVAQSEAVQAIVDQLNSLAGK